MRITTAFAGLAATIGLGALAVQGPAAVTVASRLPAAAAAPGAPAVASPAAVATAAPAAGSTSPAATPQTASTPVPATPTGTRPAPTASATAPAASASPSTPAAAPRCDDGRWRGPDGINVEGRPDNFDAGDRGAVYLWHDAEGWHLRTTDVNDSAHHYTGTIALSADARFTSFATVRLERDDHVWVDGNNVLHYDFVTYNAIDGIDFTVSACDGAREHEVMHFTMDYNGHEDDPARIALGDTKQHPDAATFAVTRTV